MVKQHLSPITYSILYMTTYKYLVFMVINLLISSLWLCLPI